mmetsp:Transcript_22551/g.64881  ORF Transcript_22551/g.64881 Transcript_22551/m.64881 type:complete len:346 (+) Transcript_22551:143-1180(+)
MLISRNASSILVGASAVVLLSLTPTNPVQAFTSTSPQVHCRHSSFRASAKPPPFLCASGSPESDASSAIRYLVSIPVEELLPSQDVLLIIDELLQSKSLIDDSEALFVKNWDSIEKRLRDETRSVKALVGDETTNRILRSVGNIDGYDGDAVRSFLSSDAINKLFSKLLFDGIVEFFDQIDVFGRIISGLPIIGPIRNQIRDEAKRNLDRTVRPLIQGFLKSYTSIAVGQASDFVMSPANRKMFGQANQKLVASILDRPVNTLLPPGDMASQLIVDVFEYVRNVETEDLRQYVEFVYGYVGNKSIERAVDVERVLEASPTLKRTVDNVWSRATSGGNAESDENAP